MKYPLLHELRSRILAQLRENPVSTILLLPQFFVCLAVIILAVVDYVCG